MLDLFDFSDESVDKSVNKAANSTQLPIIFDPPVVFNPTTLSLAFIEYIRDPSGEIVAESWEVSAPKHGKTVCIYQYWNYFESPKWFREGRKIRFASCQQLSNIRYKILGPHNNS